MALFQAAASATTIATASPRAPIPKPEQQPMMIVRRRQSHPRQRTPAALSFVAVLSATATGEAKAVSFPKEDIISSLAQAEDTIGQAGNVASKVWGFSLDVFKALIDTLKPAVDAALPILQSASNEALRAASPVVSDASEQAKEALLSAGVDPSPVFSAAQTIAGAAQQTTKIVEVAKPIAKTITSSDPSTIIVTAGALFVGYLLFPPIWSALRGYQGNLSAAQTLDLISAQDYVLIDIRSEKDKNRAGVPSLPSSAKNKIISVPLEELPNKIKGQVRSPKKVQADFVALKISYLKKLNKRSNIIILDSYCNVAKTAARTLTELGFKNSWVVEDGFSGGRGWVRSRLGSDSYNVSLVEVLSPSRVIPAAAIQSGTVTVGRAAPQPARKLLPGSVEN